MSSSEDVFRKVGRGGAGNFYSVKKEDEIAAEKVPTISICETNPRSKNARKRGHRHRGWKTRPNLRSPLVGSLSALHN